MAVWAKVALGWRTNNPAMERHRKNLHIDLNEHLWVGGIARLLGGMDVIVTTKVLKYFNSCFVKKKPFCSSEGGDDVTKNYIGPLSFHLNVYLIWRSATDPL